MRGKKVVSNFVPCPVGVHVARLIQIIDLGTQMVDYKQGKGLQEEEQFELKFETPEEYHVFNEEKGPEVFMLSKTVANKISTGKNVSNLVKIYEALTGETLTEDHNLEDAIDCLCQVNVVHTVSGDNVYAKIESFLPLSRQQRENADAGLYERYNEQFCFDLSNFNEEIFEALNKNDKGKVAKSKEYAAAISGEIQDGPGEEEEEQQPEEEQGLPFDEIIEEVYEAPAPRQTAKPAPAPKPTAKTPAAPAKTAAPAPRPAPAASKTMVPGKGIVNKPAPATAKTAPRPAAKAPAPAGKPKPKGFK